MCILWTLLPDYLGMIEVLLAGGATVDDLTLKSPKTALRMAILHQKLEAASALIFSGASLKAAARL